MYDSVVPVSSKSRQVEQEDDGKEGLRIFDTVNIYPYENGTSVILEWVGNSMNDMIADSILAIILRVEKSPSSIKALQSLQDGSLVLKQEKLEKEGKKPKIKKEEVNQGQVESKDPNDVTAEREHSFDFENSESIRQMLLKHFDSVDIASDASSITIKTGKNVALYNPKTHEVLSEDLELKKRVARITNHIFSSLIAIS